MHPKNTNGTSLLSMLKGYASHKNNSTLSSSVSMESHLMENHLEASVTLSGNEQVPDYLIGKSNGVDSSRFFSTKNIEPSLQASVTLGSGNGQVPDYLIGKSNGVDSSRFLSHEEDDLKMPKPIKPSSNLDVLGAMISPLKAIGKQDKKR